MTITLDLPLYVEWEVIPSEIGGTDEYGNQEHIPSSINITHVYIQQNGANIEITEALTDDDIETLTNNINQ